MLSKDTFVKAINEAKRAWDYQEALNDFYREHCADGYLFQPDCSEALVEVIEEAMGLERDENGYTDVSYFCYEIDYGRKFKPGCVKDNGVDVDFSTPEKLYDYIISKK
jgi:hypothetical protein